MFQNALKLSSEGTQAKGSVLMSLQVAGSSLTAQKLCPSQRSLAAGNVPIASPDVCPHSLFQGKGNLLVQF